MRGETEAHGGQSLHKVAGLTRWVRASTAVSVWLCHLRMGDVLGGCITREVCVSHASFTLGTHGFHDMVLLSRFAPGGLVSLQEPEEQRHRQGGGAWSFDRKSEAGSCRLPGEGATQTRGGGNVLGATAPVGRRSEGRAKPDQVLRRQAVERGLSPQGSRERREVLEQGRAWAGLRQVWGLAWGPEGD